MFVHINWSPFLCGNKLLQQQWYQQRTSLTANYGEKWESTKAQHQDYDGLISISHQKWSIDFLPKSITIKRDVPCSAESLYTPRGMMEKHGGEEKYQTKTNKKKSGEANRGWDMAERTRGLNLQWGCRHGGDQLSVLYNIMCEMKVDFILTICQRTAGLLRRKLELIMTLFIQHLSYIICRSMGFTTKRVRWDSDWFISYNSQNTPMID